MRLGFNSILKKGTEILHIVWHDHIVMPVSYTHLTLPTKA